MKKRVLIVDDSVFVRCVLGDLLSSSKEYEIVGRACDGVEAVQLARELKPDVITMDVEMPKQSGLEALEAIMKECPTPVVMVSTTTTKGARNTVKALELGAVDFVAKPAGDSPAQLMQLKDELLSKLAVASVAKVVDHARAHNVTRAANFATDKVILIASSTGGPKALCTLWETLPTGLKAPILLVQHMPPGFTNSLAERLDNYGKVSVKEAAGGEKIAPGCAYVAPGGMHMALRTDGTLELQDGPPLNSVKPAADILFLSAAKALGPRALGVVLTGMGRDGAKGAQAIRSAGGTVIGESEESCTVYGMPKAAKEAGAIDAEFKIGEMSEAITALLHGKVARAS